VAKEHTRRLLTDESAFSFEQGVAKVGNPTMLCVALTPRHPVLTFVCPPPSKGPRFGLDF
jgi:hypothetical protein